MKGRRAGRTGNARTGKEGGWLRGSFLPFSYRGKRVVVGGGIPRRTVLDGDVDRRPADGMRLPSLLYGQDGRQYIRYRYRHLRLLHTLSCHQGRLAGRRGKNDTCRCIRIV